MSTVPCNGCTLCCHGDVIRFLPGEDPSQYQTEPMMVRPGRGLPLKSVPGQVMLAHKLNGDCIYLADSGCSIHERKPRVCREMDCRNLARSMGLTEARRHGITLIWQRGKDLLRKAA